MLLEEYIGLLLVHSSSNLHLSISLNVSSDYSLALYSASRPAPATGRWTNHVFETPRDVKTGLEPVLLDEATSLSRPQLSHFAFGGHPSVVSLFRQQPIT